MASSITTGRFSTASKRQDPASAACLMIGTESNEPNGPGFVIVNVAPVDLVGLELLAPAHGSRGR